MEAAGIPMSRAFFSLTCFMYFMYIIVQVIRDVVFSSITMSCKNMKLIKVLCILAVFCMVKEFHFNVF